MVPAAAVIASAPSEVPVAARGGRPKTATSNGTTTIPPPTPNNALKTPATKPIASRRTIHSYRMKVGTDDLLALLAERPAEAGILLDVDGTLAPIVARPELASVPEPTRDELRRLLGRYGLVGCVSGRTGADAARVVGVDGPAYVGVHGLELAPEAERWRGPLHEFAASVDWPVADKGTAVRTLLARHDLRRGLYAGDDTTDLDAFRGLDGLELGVRIAVASAEGPAELAAAADIVVGSPAELVGLLGAL